MKEHLTLRVFGEVQGVFFRKTTKEKAHELHLVGFARNEQDGSVYIEAEGDAENLSKLKEWCQVGPSGARVKRVEAEAGDPKGYIQFEIKK